MERSISRSVCKMLCVTSMFCMLFVSSVFAKTTIKDLKDIEKKTANEIMSWVLTSNQKHYVFTSDLSVDQMIKVNEAIDNTYYADYNKLILNGKRSKRTGTVTYDVEIAGSRDFYNVNKVLNKYAKQIKKKYVKSGMSTKAKAKAIARGVANKLSYKENVTQDTMLKNLKKKKGNCSVYANLYFATCRLCGIHCQYAHVSTSVGPHVCNRVKSGKKWLYTDACWYDATGNSKYICAKSLWGSHRLSYYESVKAYSTLNYLRG